jgi:hypothetical protein
MKWDIDKALEVLEPMTLKGTSIQRCLVGVELLGVKAGATPYQEPYRHIKPTSEEVARGHVTLWSLGVGYASMPKAFFYGRTIREAYLQAFRAMKTSTLAKHTPWGKQAFVPEKKVKTKGPRGTKAPKCSRKKAWLSGDVYCSKHGREAGWPCRHAKSPKR